MQKIKTESHVLIAAKHNLRQFKAGTTDSPAIDPARSHQNYILAGADTAKGVVAEAQRLMMAAGLVKIRKNGVRMLEVLISAPADSADNYASFFVAALRWIEAAFAVPIVSAIVHLDEANPHCHVLLLPLSNGRMIGSDLMGNRSTLLARQEDFHVKVASKFGFARQAPAVRFGAPQRHVAMGSLFACLSGFYGLPAAVARALLAPHKHNLAPLICALGLPMPDIPRQASRSFVEIMTCPVKPDKPAEIRRQGR
jgi:hypothetical protein